MENIFDMESTDDLPEDMRNKILNKKDISISLKVLSLFDLKKELTCFEVMVAIFRKFGLEKKPPYIRTTLSNMARSGLVERVASSTFRRIEK